MPEVSLSINSDGVTFHTVQGATPIELMNNILVEIRRRIVKAAKEQRLVTEVRLNLLSPIPRTFQQANLPDILSGQSAEVIRIFNALGEFLDNTERRLVIAQAIAAAL